MIVMLLVRVLWRQNERDTGYKNQKSFAYGGQEIPRSPEVVSWVLSRDNHINSRLRAENQCSSSAVRSGKGCLRVSLFQSCL